MKNLNSHNDYYKTAGYSAIELLFVLVIIIGLILMTNSMLFVMARSRHNNQIADQVKVYQKAAVMYLTDNYREIVLHILQTGNNEVIQAGGNAGYLYNGVMPELSTGLAPCLYILKDDKKTLDANIKAYLIFGHVSGKLKALSFKDAIAVSNAIGGSAGVMVPTANGFKVQGLNFNSDLRFDYNLDIGAKCGFSGGHGAIGIPDNSIIIDLTADNNFFQQLVSTINPNNDNIPPPKNPSLQKSGGPDATGMRTNLYLDNVISESRTEISYYCDASKASLRSNADAICQRYANDNIYVVVSGSSYWYSSVKTGEQTCTGTAKANFTRVVSSYTCDGVNLGDPNTYNNASSKPGFVSAKWSVSTLNGDQCTAIDKVSLCGQYISTMNTAGDCHWKNISCLPGQMMHTDGCQGSGGRDYMCGSCSTGGDPMDHNACWNQFCGAPYSNDFGPTTVAAVTVNTSQSLGEMTCGTDTFEAEKSTNNIPEQHRYRGLNFGDGAVQGQKVQIKSDATTGAALDTSVLKINHAGIQSGVIGLASHTVSFGDVCQSTELGKIVQQNSSTRNDIQAQLRCTFSPVSCSEPGYCYLPVKSASREIHFSKEQQIASCPDELVLDANQPNDLFDSNVKCPDLSDQNYTLIQSIHEESYGCYTSSMSGIKFCNSIESVCTYKDNNGNTITNPMTALLGIQCVAKNNIFVVDNYKQN